MEYRFYGADDCEVSALNDVYPGIRDPKDLYTALSGIWAEDTCAPRMRRDWKRKHPSYGQCSITAFLVQDIFGGRVYGVPLEDGNFHCFNVAEGHVFDLTSEQFDRRLNYTLDHEQFREIHFSKKEKEERYELLKKRLKEYCEKKKS